MSLRQAASPNHESRPLPRDNKKLGLLKRLKSGGISLRIGHNRRSNNDYPLHQPIDTSNSTASISGYSSSNSLNILSASCSSAFGNSNYSSRKHQIYNNIRTSNKKKSTDDMTMTDLSDPLNVMHWMEKDCPKDVLPLILAFAGPQKTAVIGRTNRFWHSVVERETTWRGLCESLYKWKDGDEIPESWKKYYQYNPCVPIDYPSIHSALNNFTEQTKDDFSKQKAIRILLRPGHYILRKAITMDGSVSMDDNGKNDKHSTSVTIETMAYLPSSRCSSDVGCHSKPSQQSSEQSRRKLRDSIRSIFQCRTVDVESEDNEDYVDHDSLNEYLDSTFSLQEERPENANNSNELVEVQTEIQDANHERKNGSKRVVGNRATLVLATRRQNEPLLRVCQGSLTIRNIDLKHGSFGNDIWNGNSAIQIQPAQGRDDDSNANALPAPTVTLDGVDVTSSSGRGVVNVDGGHVNISNSHIHDCAATGIYIGGSGSRATIEQTDVIHNGRGNTKNRRGIAAGHSGIYLEQGHALITDCNISRNTLTGISAISPDNALLSLQESDLVSNGTYQLEMPDVRSIAYRNSVTLNNHLATSGQGRSRSALLAE